MIKKLKKNTTPKEKFSRDFKKDVKTILIIFSLLDGKKYSQTQIKDRVNHIMNNPIQFMKDGRIGWNNELEQGMDVISRSIDDSGVSRIIKDLNKLGIIEKEFIQVGGGAASACVQLREDINALLPILSKFQSLHFSDLSYLWLGTQLIQSEYGKKLINKELINSFNEKSDNSYTSDEKNRLLELIRLSPTALKGFISTYYITAQESSEYQKYQLFSQLVLSFLNDFKLVGFQNLPIVAEVSLIFDINKLRKVKPIIINENKLTKVNPYIINENRIYINLN